MSYNNNCSYVLKAHYYDRKRRYTEVCYSFNKSLVCKLRKFHQYIVCRLILSGGSLINEGGNGQEVPFCTETSCLRPFPFIISNGTPFLACCIRLRNTESQGEHTASQMSLSKAHRLVLFLTGPVVPLDAVSRR